MDSRVETAEDQQAKLVDGKALSVSTEAVCIT